MDWIFDHLQILIAAGAGVAYWLNQRKRAQEEENQDAEQPRADAHDVSGDEARARKIREEIRRKIAERQRGPSNIPGPAAEPPPLFRRFVEEPPVVVKDPFDRERWQDARAEPMGPSAEEQAVLKRQKLLQERMKQLEQIHAQTKYKAKNLVPKRAQSSKSSVGARSLREDLRHTDSLRKAIILREVLGPPVGLIVRVP